MAPQALFGVAPGVLNKIIDVGSREAKDSVRGVQPGTLASMVNRYYNPEFGSSGSWLNPKQYSVLQKSGFNPNNPAINQAIQYYSTPEGQKELLNAASQLKGVTDFRSTDYLQKTGNLFNYATNLIPATVNGVKQFLTPEQLKKSGAKPDLGENTFFNESPTRKPTQDWWSPKKQPAPSASSASPAAKAQQFLQDSVNKIKSGLSPQSSTSGTKETSADDAWSTAFNDAVKNLNFDATNNIKFTNVAKNFTPSSSIYSNIAGVNFPSNFSSNIASNSLGGGFGSNISSGFGNSFGGGSFGGSFSSSFG